jgi:hypothetical protein
MSNVLKNVYCVWREDCLEPVSAIAQCRLMQVIRCTGVSKYGIQGPFMVEDSSTSSRLHLVLTRSTPN